MKIPLFISMLVAASAFAADPAGYLFVTFKGESSPQTEQIYFGLSHDGRNWEALNNADPVLVSQLGEKGVRDPFILRSHNGDKTYLIATDLSAYLNRGWVRARQNGSQSIVIWETTDLVHWSAPRLVKVAADDAGCTWAPEAIYDDETNDYLVFWASQTKSDNYAKHRIWAARTKDFVTFEKPFIYIERAGQVIDTDIVRENGKYYRFSKNETSKNIIMEMSEKLMGPWSDVTGFSLSKLVGYEGPFCYQLEPAATGKPAVWCLLLDHYSKRGGYQAYITHNLAEGKFEPAPEINFPFKFRHGSILPVTAAEYERLKSTYGTPPPSN